MVESRKWGVDSKATELTSKILKSQKFYVRTGHGISEAFYAYCKEKKIFGAGQGLGWSGPLWINTSDTISQVLNEKGGGMRFVSFDGKVIVVKKGDFFIDDTATGVTEDCVQRGNTVLMQLRDDEQLHAFLLFAAGHRLALHKCSFYLVDFKRDGLKYKCLSSEELPGELHLQEGFGLPFKKVPRLEPSQAHKTLGHFLSITGDGEKQREVIQTVINEWVERIGNSTLSGSDRLLAYNAFLLPALRYKLVSLSMNYKDCQKMMKSIIPVLLNAHGIQRNASRNILFQPLSRLGFGYHHIYHIQNLEKIKIFFFHMRLQDTTADLIRIALGYMKLECGCGQNVFKLQYKDFGKYTTSTWITGIWSYIQECKTSISFSDTESYKLPRENDEFMMKVIEKAAMTREEKIIFNHVRLHLQLVSFSDIVLIDKRSTIRREIFEGRNSRLSSWNWPKSFKVPRTWLQVWQSALTSFIQPLLDFRPLGKWIQQTHQNWDTYTNDDISLLRIGNTIYNYDRGITEGLGKGLCLYPVDFENGKIVGRLKNMQQFIRQRKEFQQASPVMQIITSLQDSLRHNLGITPSVESLYAVYKTIRKRTCVGSGDGSLRKSYPSHAWCFADEDTGRIILRGAARVNGALEYITSFRAEGLAIIAQLTILQMIDRAWDLAGNSITIYSDCESVLKKVQKRANDRIKYALENDIDIILQIRDMIASTKCHIRLAYVRSHQDKHIPFPNASFPQQLNILMDEAVRHFVDNNVEHVPRCVQYPILPATKIVIGDRNVPVISGIEEVLLSNYYAKEWKMYSKSKFGIDEAVEDEFDGTYLAKALKSCKGSRNQVTKIIHGQHHTMKKSELWGTSTSKLCPLCKQCDEGRFHVWECQHECMIQIRKNERLNFEKGLEKLQTEDTIHATIQTILDYWDDLEALEDKLKSFYDYGGAGPTLWDSQRKLGWRNFLIGICSKAFGFQQEEWYRSQKCSHNLSGESWTKKVLQLMWQFYQKLWKERCRVVNEENELTADMRYRELLWEYHEKLATQSWRFSSDDRNLIGKNKIFFFHSPFRNIEIWKRQVDLATSTAKFKAKLRNRDIREFLPIPSESRVHQYKATVVPGLRTQTRSKLIPTQVTYKQLQLKYMKTRREVDCTTKRNNCSTDGVKVKRKRVQHFEGEKEYIRNWLGISKGKLRKELNKKCAYQFVNKYYTQTGEISRSAAPMTGARKIKN